MLDFPRCGQSCRRHWQQTPNVTATAQQHLTPPAEPKLLTWLTLVLMTTESFKNQRKQLIVTVNIVNWDCELAEEKYADHAGNWRISCM